MHNLAESSTKFIANESGLRWIEEHPEFVNLASEFSTTEIDRPESLFNDFEYVGMGQNSEVRSCGGLAVKFSTLSTGRSAYRLGFGIKPEDLVDQFKLLSTLGQYLGDSEDVTVPEQHFALSTPSGDIRGEQLMVGWSSLHELLIGQRYTVKEEQDICKKTKDRLTKAISSPLLRLGLDLGLGAGELLNYKNILMPEGSDPENGSLCIIDQPSPKLSGNLAVFIHGAVSSLRIRQKVATSVYA